MENIFFNMFSYHSKNSINRLIMSKLMHRNDIQKNTLKCSELRFANYTFADSLKNDKEDL